MADPTLLGDCVIAAGIAVSGGAIGAAIGDGLAGSAAIQGTARQPELSGRLQATMFVVVSLAEAMYFINVALGFYFIAFVSHQ